MYEQEEEEKTTIILFINIELLGVQRELTYAAFSNTARTFTIGTLPDNQHYSHLEALLLQHNPKEQDTIYQVHLTLPPLKSQKKKILDKTAELTTRIHQEKLGKGEVQLALSFLLKKPFNMYTKELQNAKVRVALEKLIEIVSLQRDASNKGQFQLKLVNLRSTMLLDKSTVNALQIFSKQMEKKVLGNTNTLFQIFNKCKTSFGSRCLKRWMKQPLQSQEEIQSRLDKIEYFITNAHIKNLIQNQLKKLPDLDRLYFIFYKVAAGKKTKCEVSDLIKIYRVVESLAELVSNLQQRDLSDPVIQEIYTSIKHNVEIISKISKMIEKGIDMSGSKDSEFYVRPQTQASLQTIMKQKRDIEEEINQQVFQVAKHLKLDVEKIQSNTHRYVLQANKKLAINKVKETNGYKFLTAKQTKITFITTNLSKLCEQLRAVEEQYKTEQQILLKKMFELVAGYYPVMEELSYILSELDVLTTIATIVLTSNTQWCRPRISADGIRGVAMRHPSLKNCIPNNCDLTTHKTIVLTGPNMGGKSTYIRTIGVCTYLAHLGAYVPATEFSTPVVDAIITRVGASDLQVKGISTFMSEMLQSSCMLQTSTNRSLVLIDELGRGTSTCQGFGVAWGICQYLHKNVNPFCLFATHFHEMTRMADQVEGVKNMYTTCRIQNGELELQYKVQEGKMQKSYGIEVMKMLRFPDEVVRVAQNYLEYYECEQMNDEVVSGLPQQAKRHLYELVCQMEQRLSRSPNDRQAQIREDYRGKFREILGVTS